jgi:hypothetical protein
VPVLTVSMPSQKVLFCSTGVGRQAIVRQIRPQLHIDRECPRFLCLHVPQALGREAGGGVADWGGVLTVPTLCFPLGKVMAS